MWKYKLDELAKKAIEKSKSKNLPVICRCGESPSGAKHIGNFNDNLRSYFIYKIVQKTGYPARHIQTRDNMDPFRKIPDGFVDLDRKWHTTSEEEKNKFQRYVGKPLYRVPDPLGCCKNWAEHFQRVYENECREMGLEDTEYFCTENLYRTGKFNPYIGKVFKKLEISRELITNIEKNKPSDSIPIWAICKNCGKLTGKIIGTDLDSETVTYVCTNRNLTPKYKAIGCGYRGVTDWKNSETRLDWEFEWPAQMLMFQTTIEPFGKEHFIGSWPICQKVIRRIYEGEIPIGFFYECFMIKGKRMYTRHGNIITISELLKILEPGAIRFFYTKKPEKQRNIDLVNIFRLADEFDKAERVYFGLGIVKNKKEEIKLKRSYELAVLYNIPKKFEPNIQYRTAASIVQRYSEENWVDAVNEIVRPNQKICRRLVLTKNWISSGYTKEFRIKGCSV